MLDHVLTYTAPAAYAVLPAKMRSLPATALLLAIGLQESRFTARRQFGGPARGFWQFEHTGIQAALTHKASQDPIAKALITLRYPIAGHACHMAVEHNDTLAFCFARVLLWTLPQALPGPDDAEQAWQQYLRTWNPGKPHRKTWDAFYRDAWLRVDTVPERVNVNAADVQELKDQS